MDVSEKEEEKEVLKIIGERLGKSRSDLSISQEKLSEEINMDRANYTRIENGDSGRRLRFSQLIKLSKKLNVSLDYIFGLIDEPSTVITTKEIFKEYGLTSETLKALEKINKDGDIKAINELIMNNESFIYSFIDNYKCLILESNLLSLLRAFTMIKYKILKNDSITNGDRILCIKGYRELLKRKYNNFKDVVTESTIYIIPSFDVFDICFNNLIKSCNEKNINSLEKKINQISHTVKEHTSSLRYSIEDSLTAYWLDNFEDISDYDYIFNYSENNLIKELKKEGEKE